MEYLYENQCDTYEDFASGRVLLHGRGTTAFPVRLASEIFLRGRSYLRARCEKKRYSLYDPCCGGAHLLTAIGLLNGRYVQHIAGSDIDGAVLEIAKSNLAMVNVEGIEDRIEQLCGMYSAYRKECHKDAIGSAERLMSMILERRTRIETDCFQADAAGSVAAPWRTQMKFDMVITDLPYGELVEWQSADPDPVNRLLENLLHVIAPHAVVILVADKKQVIRHSNYNRLERLKVGKRQAVFWEANERERPFY
ncbi:hypothetical protein [Paenibacillus silvisoli]|uniref:hypothetical protein n=1 Tax=Paenibacillus silvisoli TaxID=3110539 RepID=UPI00280646E7|nr:hypothetical protein [Paenibacillus silvisoli]